MSLENRVAVKWQWQQLSGAIAAQQDSWEGGGGQWSWSWQQRQPTSGHGNGQCKKVKLGNGNRVTAVHSKWWRRDGGAATLASTVAAQQG